MLCAECLPVNVLAPPKRCKLTEELALDRLLGSHVFDQRANKAIPVNACLVPPEQAARAAEAAEAAEELLERLERRGFDSCSEASNTSMERRGTDARSAAILAPKDKAASSASDDLSWTLVSRQKQHSPPLLLASEQNACQMPARVRSQLTPAERRAHLLRVEDAVSQQMDACDPERTLDAADFHNVLTDVTETVMRVMNEGARTEFNDEDRNFISWRVKCLVRPGPGACEALTVPEFGMELQGKRRIEVAKPMRFQRLDRVVCRLGGNNWESGVVQHAHDDAHDDADDAENHGHQTEPRSSVHVMIDSCLVVVPEDDCHLQRAAACNRLA